MELTTRTVEVGLIYIFPQEQTDTNYTQLAYIAKVSVENGHFGPVSRNLKGNLLGQ